MKVPGSVLFPRRSNETAQGSKKRSEGEVSFGGVETLEPWGVVVDDGP